MESPAAAEDDRPARLQSMDTPEKNTRALQTIIRNHFPCTTTSSRQDLVTWYRLYKAAPNSIGTDDETIKITQEHSPDEQATELCLQELSQHITTANRLCAICQSHFDSWPGNPHPDPMRFPCHTLIVEAAARQGCRFCQLVFTNLEDAEHLDILRKIEIRLLYLGVDETCTLSILRIHAEGQQSLWVDLPGKPCKHWDEGLARTGRFESDALDLDVHIPDHCEQKSMPDIVKNWLETCDSKHNERECCRFDKERLPTRLISVTGDIPKLVLTSMIQQKVQYSTLSHRWGDLDFFKLTDENLSSLFKAIPLEVLPKTFRDAIHITRQLGLKYLWIDSLCIVQGNRDDWYHEAGLMSSVYGGSYVNIAASDATNAHEGLFIKQSHMRSALDVVVKIGGKPMIREFRHLALYAKVVRNSHLATRAWALQEKILPLRTIHFGKRGVFWECRSMFTIEDVPDGFSFMHHIPIGIVNSRERTEFFEEWWVSILYSYTSAKLTFGKDRLPALAGIARSVFEERGGKYLAGLWHQPDAEADWLHQYDFRTLLCWSTIYPQVRPQWRAPSWSWASIDSAVEHGRTFNKGGDAEVLRETYAYLMDADIEYLSDDIFGAVEGGTLHVACEGLLVGKYNGNYDIKISRRNGHGTHVFTYKPDDLDETQVDSNREMVLLPIYGGYTGMMTRKDGHVGNRDNMTKVVGVFGIVLRPVHDQAGVFRRVGMFEFNNDESTWHEKIKKKSRESFLDIYEKHGKRDAKDFCREEVENEKHPEHRYIVSIT